MTERELEQKKDLASLMSVDETAAEDLFVVEGLDSETAEGETNAEFLSLLAAGSEITGSPLDLADDNSVVAELAAGSAEEEVLLNATEGELAAVLPPESAQETDTVEHEAVVDEPVDMSPIRRFKPWMGAAIAASLVLGTGGLLKFTTGGATPATVSTVAEQAPPEPLGAMPLDAACHPREVAPVEAASLPSGPMVAAVVDWAEATPVPHDEVAMAAVTPGPMAVPVVVPVAEPMVVPNEPAPVPVEPPAPSAPALARGAEVIIGLRNGSVFTGRLQKYTVTESRIRVAKGEIEFPAVDVDAVLPVANAPGKRGPEAVVYLRNGNRIAGQLIEEGATKITLSLGGAEVALERAEIIQIEKRPAVGLLMGDQMIATKK